MQPSTVFLLSGIVTPVNAANRIAERTNKTMKNIANQTTQEKTNSRAPEVMVDPLHPRQHRHRHGLEVTIPNLDVVKARQRATWESGDFGQIARTIENVAEEFMARQTIPDGAQVLDVACGTGNLAVIAARRGGVVSGIDIASNLIAQARTRAAAEGLRIAYQQGDAEAMPYADGQFDLVVSMFGVMFAPRPTIAVGEMARATFAPPDDPWEVPVCIQSL